MSSIHYRKKISDLPELTPSSDSFMVVGNQSHTTGVTAFRDLTTNFLSNIMSGSDDFSGLNDYLEHHGGGGGGGGEADLSSMIAHLSEAHASYDTISGWSVVLQKTADSTKRFDINSFLSVYFSPDLMQDEGRDTVNTYMRINTENYIGELEGCEPESITDTMRVVAYDHDNSAVFYLSLSDLADYINNNNS